MFGNGTGHFGALKVTPPLPDIPEGILRADLNGDGIVDLVVSTPSVAYVLLGKGDGTFSPPTALNTPGFVVAVADFDGDGHSDLLVEPSLFYNSAVEVLLGNGDGTFRTPVTTTLASQIQVVTAGDFNRDGKADLAVTYVVGYSALPAVLLGNGDGTFGSPQPFPLPNDTVAAMQVADLNHDGNPDLAVVMFNLSTVVLLPGDGQGHFGTASVYGVSGGRPTALVIADFNGDGKPDVATNNGSSISVLLHGK